MYEWRTGRSCVFKNNIHLIFVTKYCRDVLTLAMLDRLKGKSSYFLRNEFWEKIKHRLWGVHFWSPSYCVVSCGGASLDVIKSYIKNQRKPPSDRQIKQSRAISKIGLACPAPKEAGLREQYVQSILV